MQGAGGGQKVVVRVLGANARLNGVAVDREFALCKGQLFTAGYPELPLHQVLPGDGFRNRMLHLQAGVHLHEEKRHAAIGFLLHDEFHRASANVVHRARRRHRRRAHLLAEGFSHARRRRFFQDFLVATLHGTIALKQVDVVAVGIAKHLYLNVAGPLHVLFDQHGIITKAVDRLALATGQRGGKVFGLVDGSHPLATAPSAGFDEHGVANAVGFTLQQSGVLVRPVVARHQRYAGLFH